MMIVDEFGSTGAAEMSWFQRLSAGKGTKPFKLALCPRFIPLHVDGGPPDVLEVTCRFMLPEVVLPGLGFTTATENVPADMAFPLADNCVEEMNVVARGAPANRI